MSDLTTKISLLIVAALACFGAGWFAHAPAPTPAVVRTVQVAAAKAETVFVRDTLRLTQWRTHYDTTRDTVLRHLTDTVQIARFIQVADSTLGSCVTALSSCRTALDAQKLVVSVQRETAPSRTRQFLTAAFSFGLGYGARALTHPK